MNWRVKAVLQMCLANCPGGGRVNDYLQRVAGGLRNPDAHIAGKLKDWIITVGYLREVEFSWQGATLVEIGTGWFPTFPFCFSLIGAGCVKTFDIERHIDSDLTFKIIAALGKHLEAIAGAAGVPLEDVRERYRRINEAKNLEALLGAAGVEYFAPADARDTHIPAGTVDLVYSNSVMEHVPKDAIRGLMQESVRILRPGGMALHNVCCGDHYAFFDPSISFVNFLKYEEKGWRIWNNSLLYQNRLRSPDFLNLASEAGLKVLLKRNFVRPGTYEALASMKVAEPFQHLSTEDLAQTTIDFVAQKMA